MLHTSYDSKNVLLEMYNDYLWKRQDDLWAEKALEYLPAIEDATTMLVCAEDLGTVPVCAPRVLDSLNITRLIIQVFIWHRISWFSYVIRSSFHSIHTPKFQ